MYTYEMESVFVFVRIIRVPGLRVAVNYVSVQFSDASSCLHLPNLYFEVF